MSLSYPSLPTRILGFVIGMSAPLAAFASPASAQTYDAFVYASQPASPTYVVAPGPYASRSASIQKASVGAYHVTFSGVATWPTSVSGEGGIALATAVGPDTTSCYAALWSRAEMTTDLTVLVLCRSPAGVLTDSAFSVRYHRRLAGTPGRSAYAHVQTFPPLASSTWVGVASAAAPYNEAQNTYGASPAMRRWSAGKYTLRFFGDFSGVQLQPVVVTNIGDSSTPRCNLGFYSRTTANMDVYVQCWHSDGTPRDSTFSLLIDDGRALASQPGVLVSGTGSVLASNVYVSPRQTAP